MQAMDLRITLSLLVSAFCCACNNEPVRDFKQTTPVTGRVLVDGEPAEGLTIDCRSLAGPDTSAPTHSTGNTDKDGNFSLSTYKIGDGVPEGEYALLFKWGIIKNALRRQNVDDKLNGRYQDPQKSQVKFTVDDGQPVDLGDIKLATKD